MEHTVQLYVYDMTKGLAAQLSQAFLGTLIEGVWHTGVVVYGTEYFYGGGIEYTIPGTLPMLGRPDKILDLGTTYIPKEVFVDFLDNISAQYTAETYNLLEHNCNHFSDDVVQFLTGSHIPSYILDQHKEIIPGLLRSPFGAQLKPFLDSMQGPSGGTSINGQR